MRSAAGSAAGTGGHYQSVRPVGIRLRRRCGRSTRYTERAHSRHTAHPPPLRTQLAAPNDAVWITLSACLGRAVQEVGLHELRLSGRDLSIGRRSCARVAALGPLARGYTSWAARIGSQRRLDVFLRRRCAHEVALRVDGGGQLVEFNVLGLIARLCKTE